MNKAEIEDLTEEDYPTITRKICHLGDHAPVKLPSGSTKYLLGEIENMSLWVIDSQSGIKFEEPGHPEEVMIFVLEGLVMYENKRAVRAQEAVFQCPNTPYKGRYAGTESVRLLCLKVVPKSDTNPPDPALMNKVVRVADVVPQKAPFGTGTLRIELFRTENLVSNVRENKPVMEFDDLGHWDPEIVYGLEGKIEYFDGRIVRPGECALNGYNVPHPGRYGSLSPRVRIIESGTSLYRVGGGHQLDGQPLPGYIKGWHNQTLQQRLADLEKEK
ncbi:hypothetical protein ACFLUS_04335 [Chloroflexota bacterium]